MTRAARSLQFTNLPLVETVVRLYFPTNVRIDFRLVSDLHQKLGSEFPNVSPPTLLETSPALSGPQMLIAPGALPGAEYAGGPHGLSLQLQQQMVAARWRRAISEHAPDYPRYGRLRAILHDAINHLQGCVGGADLSPCIANMTYVNFIRVENPRPYLKDEHLTGTTIGAKTVQEQIVAWQAQNGVDLRFEVRGAERTAGAEREGGYLLTTAAGRRLDPGDNTFARLDDVHDELQVLFADLISDRAKDEWGFSNGNAG